MTHKNLMFPDLVSRLNASRREIYEERAGVREFDAGLPRAYAECAALLDVAAMDALAFTGVTLLKVQQGPVTRFHSSCPTIGGCSARNHDTPVRHLAQVDAVVQQLVDRALVQRLARPACCRPAWSRTWWSHRLGATP